MKRSGFQGIVFDKDNCLTLPEADELVPELEEAWNTCNKVFDQGNILIVSNSAGTLDDKGAAQAQRIEKALGVPVLRHSVKKPGCLDELIVYFRTKGLEMDGPSMPLVIVGDRLLTDVMMGGMMDAGTIWTNRLFKQNQTTTRWIEETWMKSARRRGSCPQKHSMMDAFLNS